jgi:acetyltransferase
MRPPDFHDAFEVDGNLIIIRTMRPEDRKIEQDFVQHLSVKSRYNRFHSTVKELSPVWLERFTNVNYPHEMALVATTEANGVELEIGVARYARDENSTAAEMAIVVADEWQRRGIATRLLQGLWSCAQVAGISGFRASVLADNRSMYALARKLGYNLSSNNTDRTTLELGKDSKPTED